MDATFNYTVIEIAGITKGTILQKKSQAHITHILLDSRKLLFPETTIFFAIDSNRRKGTGFIKYLYKKNVRSFLIEDKNFDITPYPDADFILTGDTLHAFQLLAADHRNKFKTDVIGITGSNGKTIVKEWLYQLLQHEYNIVRSPKSYNSQIGVPLSVLQMDNQHTLSIFEAGISQPGEMQKLEKIIQPTIGVFTNMGDAHDEGFENREQKIQEKLKLFTHCSVLILCIDDNELNESVNKLKEENGELQLFTWSKKNVSSLQIISVEKQNAFTLIKVKYATRDVTIKIPFWDDASIENAITCWCVMLQLKLSDEVITDRMWQLHPVEMRLELKQGINNCTIINDSYSADINSLKIALDFLHQQKHHQKQTVILSDILQSGKTDDEMYREIALLLKQKNIDKLITVGSRIHQHQQQFSFLKEKHFFISLEELKSHFNSLHFKDETILLKGARVFEFEQIDHLLEQKVHQTILSINLSSIVHNVKVYQNLLQPSVKIMAMVKAFSYGSGSFEIANLLQFNNVDYLAVAYADEGVELRRAGITLPVMVMNPEESTFNALVQYDLEPEIFSFSILSSLEKYVVASGIKNFPVHIKIDTGMHRLGFEKEDIGKLADHLKNNDTIKVQSVFSHLSASDNKSHDAFTNKQASVFLSCCNEIRSVLNYNFLSHIANTSAIGRHPELQMDMVRIGIGLYGIDSNMNVQKKLKNVSHLTTTIAQIKNVKKGESIGYGCETILKNNAVIATVRIGYADGYPRSLSNGKGKMLIKNIPAPVIGNVCMDMTMLDVTDINCMEGDVVEVFGEHLHLQELAKWGDTIPYEIMTGISQRVKRIYFEE